ncbi:MAG TPA: hypothetical protein VFY71_06260 [Planctomycetota bacterium]|nr:hypothetical protein [Planctomycetota bacterium]
MTAYPIFVPGGLGPGERDSLRNAERGAERATQDIESLQAELQRLTLACAALWSLVKEHGHTDEELLARMQELDLRDGKLDGRITADAVTCAGCGRKTKAGRRTCLYCGKDLPAGPAFG